MRKGDFYLAGGVFLVALFFYLLFLLSDPREGKVVKVTCDGEVFGVYRLDQDQEVEIHGTNHLSIRDGAAFMSKADCPDQICVRHSRISRKGASILCVPNRVAVTIEQEKETGDEDLEPFDGLAK